MSSADFVYLHFEGLLTGSGSSLYALIDVLAGQLLAFFRCLSLGLRPDAPSSDGVIRRVVEEFGIHRR